MKKLFKKIREKREARILKTKINIRKVKPAPKWFCLHLVVLLMVGTFMVSEIRTYSSVRADNVYEHDPTVLTMDFVGDIMLAGNEGKLGEARDFSLLFHSVEDSWQNADLVFGNLESAALEDMTSSLGKNTREACSFEAIDAARAAGLNVIAVGNDRQYNYGYKAMNGLMDYFADNAVCYSGLGRSENDAAQVRFIPVNGKMVAFISITDVYYENAVATKGHAGVLSTQSNEIFELVSQASDQADLTITYVHWGKENQIKANDDQKKLGRKLIDSGADIIIGTHPQVLQEIEQYRNGLIFYSLGSFINDDGFTYNKDSVMVEMKFYEDGTGTFELIPYRIENGIPVRTTNAYYRARINNELTKQLDENIYSTNQDGNVEIRF